MHNVEGNLKLGRAVTDPTPSLDVVVDRPDKPEEACGVFAVLASDQPVAFVTSDKAATLTPVYLAIIASGTVDMPTKSAPMLIV